MEHKVALIERVRIRYDTRTEQVAAQASMESLLESGFSYVGTHHVKDDPMHYTGEAVMTLERQVNG